jgi:hypothetical protein
VLLALSFAAGCGSGKHLVRGQLLYEDNEQPVKELSGFDVTFTSEELGQSARGTIDDDGRFELTAPAGAYVVIVTQPHRKPERPFVGDPVVDFSYENPEKTDLKAEVGAGSTTFTFKLRRLVRGMHKGR